MKVVVVRGPWGAVLKPIGKEPSPKLVATAIK